MFYNFVAAYHLLPVEPHTAYLQPLEETSTLLNLPTTEEAYTLHNTAYESKEVKLSQIPDFQPLSCCDPHNIIFGAAAEANICKCEPELCRKNGLCCPGCPGEDCDSQSHTMGQSYEPANVSSLSANYSSTTIN